MPPSWWDDSLQSGFIGLWTSTRLQDLAFGSTLATLYSIIRQKRPCQSIYCHVPCVDVQVDARSAPGSKVLSQQLRVFLSSAWRHVEESWTHTMISWCDGYRAYASIRSMWMRCVRPWCFDAMSIVHEHGRNDPCGCDSWQNDVSTLVTRISYICGALL